MNPESVCAMIETTQQPKTPRRAKGPDADATGAVGVRPPTRGGSVSYERLAVGCEEQRRARFVSKLERVADRVNFRFAEMKRQGWLTEPPRVAYHAKAQALWHAYREARERQDEGGAR